jgi:hypothetical protein
MKRFTIMALAVLMLLFATGCVDREAYLNKVRPIAAEMDGITHYETDGTPITYGDYIPKIKATGDRIEVLIRTVRSEKSPFDEQKTDSLHAYLVMCGKFMTQLADFKDSQARAEYVADIPNYTQEIINNKQSIFDAYKEKRVALQETSESLIKIADFLDSYVPRDCLANEKFFIEAAKVKI